MYMYVDVLCFRNRTRIVYCDSTTHTANSTHGARVCPTCCAFTAQPPTPTTTWRHLVVTPRSRPTLECPSRQGMSQVRGTPRGNIRQASPWRTTVTTGRRARRVKTARSRTIRRWMPSGRLLPHRYTSVVSIRNVIVVSRVEVYNFCGQI